MTEITSGREDWDNLIWFCDGTLNDSWPCTAFFEYKSHLIYPHDCQTNLKDVSPMPMVYKQQMYVDEAFMFWSALTTCTGSRLHVVTIHTTNVKPVTTRGSTMFS
jgi:hypothetical protein